MLQFVFGNYKVSPRLEHSVDTLASVLWPVWPRVAVGPVLRCYGLTGPSRATLHHAWSHDRARLETITDARIVLLPVTPSLLSPLSPVFYRNASTCRVPKDLSCVRAVTGRARPLWGIHAGASR